MLVYYPACKQLIHPIYEAYDICCTSRVEGHLHLLWQTLQRNSPFLTLPLRSSQENPLILQYPNRKMDDKADSTIRCLCYSFSSQTLPKAYQRKACHASPPVAQTGASRWRRGETRLDEGVTGSRMPPRCQHCDPHCLAVFSQWPINTVNSKDDRAERQELEPCRKDDHSPNKSSAARKTSASPASPAWGCSWRKGSHLQSHISRLQS